MDWPQHLGPRRDGRAGEGETLPKQLTGELAPLWSSDCGQGYAGVAIQAGKVIVFDRVASHERVRALDLNDGKELWQCLLDAEYSGGADPDQGPRCVPSIAGDRVVVYGAAGRLSCLQFSDGKLLWSRPLRKELNADSGYFGAGSAPLQLDDKVLVNVGSKQKAGVVAVDLATGKNLWATLPCEASYAAPIRLNHSRYGKSPVVLFATRLTAYGVEANTGKKIFEFPFGMRGPTVNAATPIELEDGQLFLTASYGIGSCLLEVDGEKVKTIYSEDSQLLASQYSTPLYWKGRMYASDGREDMGENSLKCFDPIQRKVYWEQSGIGVSHLVGINDSVLVLGIDGTLWTLGTETDRFDKRTHGKLPAGLYRGLPALSRGTLVVRDSGHANAQRIHAFR